MDTVVLSTTAVFLFVLVTSVGLVSRLERRSERRRLASMKWANASWGEVAEDSSEGRSLFGDDSAFGEPSGPGAGAPALENPTEMSRLRRRLALAGYRRSDAVLIYNAIRLTALIGLVSGYVFLALSSGASQEIVLLGSAGAAILGFVVPSAILDNRVKRRKREVERDLPSTVDLLAVSVDAGMGMMQALSRVGREIRRISPVLSEELTLIALETSAGKTNADAMREFAARVDTREASLLVNMLVQTERFGTNVADALRAHSEDMRVFRLQAAEERAGKAAIRMLMPTSVIMMSLLVVILGLAGIQAASVLG